MAQLSVVISEATSSNTFDLAALGPLDWFAYPASASPVKKTGTSYLSAVKHIGSNAFTDAAYTGGPTLSWSGGTPTASGSSTGGIYVSNGASLNYIDSGYQLTAPADTNVRTLRVFCGRFSSRLRITAVLSDESVATQAIEFGTYVAGSGGNNDVQITFAAASAGQTLTVSINMADPAGGGRNVSLSGAALSGPAPAGGGITVTGVTVTPATATVNGGSTQQFSAAVAGANNPSQEVTWTASAGTITVAGLWTAPAGTSSAQTVTITAKSKQNGTTTGTATVTIPATSLVQRTFTVQLEIAKDVPAANLSGGSIAFYEEQLPGSFGTVRYQSNAVTLNGSGTLTFTCQTLLTPGQKGRYVLSFPDGKHFNGLATAA
jgi:hypothetical protein